MNPAMRRIPRPQRSIDQTLSLPHLPRHRPSASPCRAALNASSLLCTTSAPFSTSQNRSSLLSNDKQKHKASIRKWQKRLLGDAEPIGAHVDPYDPTSPVRIAPEETGEELEVLAESRVNEKGEIIEEVAYEPAENAARLRKVGGPLWVKQKEEERLAQRFEQLVGRPSIARYTFGPSTPVTDRKELLNKFHQAVVEVYTLKAAGKDMDLATYGLRGDYQESPVEFSSVKLGTSAENEPVLLYPSPEVQAELLETIQNAKPQEPEPEELVDEAEDLAEEVEAEPEIAEAIKVNSSPVVKKTEGKPFDFMTNRPVKREEAAVVEEPTQPVIELDLEAATENLTKEISTIRHAVLEAAAKRSEDAVSELRKTVRGHVTSHASKGITVQEPVNEVPYGRIQLTDPAVKFALSKRLLALTGIRLSDPQLNASSTLSDMLSHLRTAVKPKPTKVFEKIRAENKLPRLPNVKLYPKRVTEEMKEREVGRWKVIEFALAERGLPVRVKGEKMAEL